MAFHSPTSPQTLQCSHLPKKSATEENYPRVFDYRIFGDRVKLELIVTIVNTTLGRKSRSATRWKSQGVASRSTSWKISYESRYFSPQLVECTRLLFPKNKWQDRVGARICSIAAAAGREASRRASAVGCPLHVDCVEKPLNWLLVEKWFCRCVRLD